MFNNKFSRFNTPFEPGLNRYFTVFRSMFTPMRFMVLVLIVIGLWMASGAFKSKEKRVEAKQAVKVRTMESKAAPKSTVLQFNGITKSHKSITIRPEVAGAVTKVFAKDGDFLKAGTVILQIDQENRKKLYQQAESELNSAKIQFEAARITYEKKFSSKNYFIEANSKLKMAEASLESARRALEKTTIKAPFDGYLEAIKVKEGDYVANAIGSVIGQFSSMDSLIATVYASQSDLEFIDHAAEAIVVGANDTRIPGKVTFVGRVADASTRTFPVEVTISNAKQLLRIGESVTVELKGDTDEGLHYIPKSSVVLDSVGKIGIKVLSRDGSVATKNVTIRDEDHNGFWISGLEEVESIITMGAAFVAEGDQVQVE